MNEQYFMTCRVWAAAAWAATVGLIFAGWMVLLFDQEHWMIGGILAASGCAMSAVAATLHIRSFMVRMCSLIRAAHSVDLSDDEAQGLGLHPVK